MHRINLVLLDVSASDICTGHNNSNDSISCRQPAPAAQRKWKHESQSLTRQEILAP
ncbi:unnamed protein product [Schistosoma margrebowiei]|uniref:Uncharacterized protein n=1 Tax=Schistosoma margrebowiei TaxID=48269 RepID=A0A183MHE6_9TREM|nr:unnamed protein product [Schistosoma margrebowiei]